MSLQSLIDEAHSLGLRVNNLFEKADGGWQANLRDAEEGHAFGFGDNPENALWRALERAKETISHRSKPAPALPAPTLPAPTLPAPALAVGLFD